MLLNLLFYAMVARFRSRAALEAEPLALRHQLLVVHCRRQFRPRLTLIDRLIWIWLYRVWPRCLDAMIVVKPDTVVRWHRAGFRTYWRLRSGSRGGRPRIDFELRSLIREMNRDNPLWGAPRIHGELLKPGIEVAQSTVAKYMIKRRGPPSQSWGTFLRNHAPEVATIYLFGRGRCAAAGTGARCRRDTCAARGPRAVPPHVLVPALGQQRLVPVLGIGDAAPLDCFLEHSAARARVRLH
ncbi:MAG TPA: hypothetical protein VIM38_06180 [Alphaproteobacteria bacterium]